MQQVQHFEGAKENTIFEQIGNPLLVTLNQGVLGTCKGKCDHEKGIIKVRRGRWQFNM